MAAKTAQQQNTDPLGKVLVIIPTYNEAENIGPIVARLRSSVPDADILIADDNSPDGTGRLADEMAAQDDHIKVMHRASKQGLGATYVAGFRWGMDNGYGVLVEHDADGSHQPEELPRLLAALEYADMVKGSRWVKGGSVRNWPWHREVLSRGGSLWSRVALGLPIKDITGGFSAFRASTLQGIGLDNIEAAGYAFQVDLARRAVERGFKVVEVPIEFVERELGASKMSSKIVTEALMLTTRWGAAKRLDQLKGVFGLASSNAQRVAGQVGEKVGPAGDKAVQEAQRLAGEVAKLAADLGDKMGPEVEKYAKEASRVVGELSTKVLAEAKQLKAKIDERRGAAS